MQVRGFQFDCPEDIEVTFHEASDAIHHYLKTHIPNLPMLLDGRAQYIPPVQRKDAQPSREQSTTPKFSSPSMAAENSEMPAPITDTPKKTIH